MDIFVLVSFQLSNSFTAFSAGDTVKGVYLVFLNTFKLSNDLMDPKTGDLAYIEPKLQNGGRYRYGSLFGLPKYI